MRNANELEFGGNEMQKLADNMKSEERYGIAPFPLAVVRIWPGSYAEVISFHTEQAQAEEALEQVQSVIDDQYEGITDEEYLGGKPTAEIVDTKLY